MAPSSDGTLGSVEPQPLEALSTTWVSGRRRIDIDELLALAEYLAPLRPDGSTPEATERDAVAVLVEWAEADHDLLGRAWRRAVLRSRAGEVRHAAVELLWNAARSGADSDPT